MIGISLICHDRLEWLERLQDDLDRSDLAAWSQVRVAVDNGSSQPVSDFLRSKGWIVLRNPVNVGIISARNQTFWRLAAENVEHILEIHTDMRFPRFWFTPLLRPLDDPDVWQACSRIVTGQEEPLDLAKAEPEEIEELCAAKLIGKLPDSIYTRIMNHPCLHRMKPFRNRGFYDDNLMWQGFEDTDWYLEIQRSGHKTVVVPDSVVYHLQGGQRFELAPDRMIPNEAYVRDKWRLKRGWHEDLYTRARDGAYVLLASSGLCSGTMEGYFALALVKRGVPVVYIQPSKLETRIKAPNLSVIEGTDPFTMLDTIRSLGIRGGRAFLLSGDRDLADCWLRLVYSGFCGDLRARMSGDLLNLARQIFQFSSDPGPTMGTCLPVGKIGSLFDEERLIDTQESWDLAADRYLRSVA